VFFLFQDTSCSQISLELRQTVSLVYDMVILGMGNQDFSIKKLFGIGLSGACSLATMSNIYIDITLNEVCQRNFFMSHHYILVTQSVKQNFYQ
jgi:hypothetical protein